MSEEKLREAREMLDSLYHKVDKNESFSVSEQMAFDLLGWLLDDMEKPELD